MKPKHLLFGTLSTVLSASAVAGSMGSEPWLGVMTFSAGPAWTQAGRTQTFFFAPFIENSYVAEKKTRTLAAGEFFAGFQHRILPNYIGQLGLAIAKSSRATLTGDVWEDANPEFDNFTYTYAINHMHIAGKGKILADMGWMVQPYIAGSVGVAENKSHAYTMISKLPAVIPAAGFNQHRTIALTYTVGAGLQKQLNAHWHAGLGYELADWGKSSLALAPNQTMGHGLRLNHFYTNQLQLSMSYIG